MEKAGKVSRWASLKTVAQLCEYSVRTVRQAVAGGRWWARRVRKRGALRVALGLDGWPLPPPRPARAVRR